MREVLKAKLFDQLVVVPSGNPWQKAPSASAVDRFEMTRLALEDLPLTVSDIESKSSKPSYAIETSRALKELLGTSQITWILGSDAILGIDSWQKFSELVSEIDFLVIERPGFKVDKSRLSPDIKLRTIEISALDVSATQVRELIATSGDVSALIPDNVAKYIKNKGLYATA